ncbi:hypothetical protein BJ973_002319 [Actinoplanes tereljensis]|uniref:Protein kinase domain-containing protein n=1 Tax=Paractinoplanes tereljensis TaxID=571912 RepID=A0A919TT09_9ACTN|nr:serine/threonine protein phosphatase [Actinoplanes tereljensis]GIF21993.1 hypothetical protein Ate02nite_47230 [Actinoplanes tereljensis]
MLASRHSRHARASASLAAGTDDQLAALVSTGDEVVGAGGGSSVIDVGGVPVFAKRIPLTDRELANPGSTANLYDVPLSCQYGMFRLAGPGFGGWRELAANQVVTEGVLAGKAEAFPLLYHWRVLPGRPAVSAEHCDIGAVVAQFGGASGVRVRLEELAGATFSLVLFLEYIPSPLKPAVSEAETFERQLFEIVAFLGGVGLLHMDGHLGNFRSDGDQIYLGDFGLATSARFELSHDEQDFVARHVGYDADYAAMRLVNWLVTATCGVGEDLAARNAYVRRCATGYVPADVPPAVAGILGRHARAAARLNDLCWRQFDGDIQAEYQAS